jgi:FkbM family methyltransferase
MIKKIICILFDILFFLSGSKKWKLKFLVQEILEKKNFIFIHKNKKITFKVDSEHCLKRYKSLLFKEKKTISWINNMKRNDIFWDIGANIGIYSIYAAKVNNLKVISFEPIVSSYHTLIKNVKENELQKKVFVYPLALTNFNGDGYIFFESNHSGSAGHALLQNSKNNSKNFQTTLSIKPDFFLENFNRSKPNHIKIDTDGNELSILKSMVKILKKNQLKSICVENQYDKMTKARENYMINFLRKYKFILKDKENLVAGYNMFFFKK